MMKFPSCSISFTTRCLLVIIGISLTYIMVNGKLDYTNHAYNYNREELHRITSCSDPYPLKVDENGMLTIDTVAAEGRGLNCFIDTGTTVT